MNDFTRIKKHADKLEAYAAEYEAQYSRDSDYPATLRRREYVDKYRNFDLTADFERLALR